MNKTKKAASSKKNTKVTSSPIINSELEKYHSHPVILKKVELAKRMVG